MVNLRDAMHFFGAGMKVQSSRIRVAAENLANAESTATTPEGDPYRRKTVVFGEELDREHDLRLVDIKRYGTDPSPFPTRHEPGHPAADEAGFVRLPNVKPLVELMDMREAQRSYEANLNAMSVTRSMLKRTLDLLR